MNQTLDGQRTSIYTFSEADRQELDQIKEFIRTRLRQQKAVSELIWDVARAMAWADARALWQMDLESTAAATVGGKKKRKKKKDKPTLEMWARLVFGMSERQARKYVTVARLSREYVAGTGLCLDRMEQVSFSPLEIRDLIRDLGIEGLSAHALSVASLEELGGTHAAYDRLQARKLLCGNGFSGADLLQMLRGQILRDASHLACAHFVDEGEDECACGEDHLFVRTARVVRHRGAILMLMGQDLLCVSRELFGLAGLVGIMAQRNPVLFEHARDHVGALRGHGYHRPVAEQPPCSWSCQRRRRNK